MQARQQRGVNADAIECRRPFHGPCGIALPVAQSYRRSGQFIRQNLQEVSVQAQPSHAVQSARTALIGADGGNQRDLAS
jgi:hypothetical protein